MNIGQVPNYETYTPSLLARYSPEAPRLDRDSTAILNRSVPLRLLRQAALSGEIPENLKREFLISVFTRALMPGENVLDVAQALRVADPRLAPLIAAYEHAANNLIAGSPRRF